MAQELIISPRRQARKGEDEMGRSRNENLKLFLASLAPLRDEWVLNDFADCSKTLLIDAQTNGPRAELSRQDAKPAKEGTVQLDVISVRPVSA